MQKSTVQTSHQDPSQNSFDVTIFLLNKASEEYQRVTIDMYGQQMANIKTYLWTANLILTGAIFILFQFKGSWNNPDVSIVALGLFITVICCLIAIPLILSCLLCSFIRPIVGYPLWENWHKDLNRHLKDKTQTDSEFLQTLLERYDEAIEANRKNIVSNGNKLSLRNKFLIVGIGMALLSLLFLVPCLIKGGI